MPASQLELPNPPAAGRSEYSLQVLLDFTQGAFHFEWQSRASGQRVGRGVAAPSLPLWRLWTFDWEIEDLRKEKARHRGNLTVRGSSIASFVARLREWFPVDDSAIRIGFAFPSVLRALTEPHAIRMPEGPWKWLHQELRTAMKCAEEVRDPRESQADRWRKRAGARWLRARVPPELWLYTVCVDPPEDLQLNIRFEVARRQIGLIWTARGQDRPLARAGIRPAEEDSLEWWLEEAENVADRRRTGTGAEEIVRSLLTWFDRWPVRATAVTAERIRIDRRGQPLPMVMPPFRDDDPPWPWLALEIQEFLRELKDPGAASEMDEIDGLLAVDPFLRREFRRREADADLRRRVREGAERRRRQEEEREMRRARATAAARALPEQEGAGAGPAAAALPGIPVRFEAVPTPVQLGLTPLADLSSWFLRERALQWWVSNQTDDLLALPLCRIDRLEYQIRTALRVVGPLRGRALLSDEVGLGKTIEAGLVLREYVTRGMVRRFLVVTQPSLVDQWAEELSGKFGLSVATSNQPDRADPERFWAESPGMVVSLHLLKQPSHLAVARTVAWDLLIVDEAHHLRNRESQAWQAVNALTRQFLLLLTATPVQNSLEELYNLVTLLQPGQLPSPREFRARFLDPKRPRQPKEPEELRRLLQQVMIRNTRSNAGIQLPSRRAQTVFFEASAAERAFWLQWEAEFREELGKLTPSLASLWGRLVLQAAGSSPAAWRDSLKNFPNRAAAQRWSQQEAVADGWNAKCALLAPLAGVEGGLVVFTQFLATQAALETFLREARIPVVTLNGQTPAEKRQPLTELFRRQGGVLLLTRSGTEGRNLQFSSRLVNFDLPWNPMEIEQRIGRLHRLGQTRVVHIYNLAAQDTLQHHLVDLLQEKLNLFELVVGETGLILGERFASEEFAEEVLQRWRGADGKLAEALAKFGEELSAARAGYLETRDLDETLFARDYETL